MYNKQSEDDDDKGAKEPLKSEQDVPQAVILQSDVSVKQRLSFIRDNGEANLPGGDGRSQCRSPPDGGWRAWLVCIASFYVNGAMFGVINSGGVLYVKLKERYAGDGDASLRISLVGSLTIGITFLLSPVASILTEKFGIQKTAFVGSLMVITGVLLSSFVDSVELLYLTYGVVFGTGASLAYTPSLVILGHYFKRNLGVVNGIVTAGSSLFTIVLPLGLNVTLNKFGLHATYQMLAALMAPLLLCALIFKPLNAPLRRVPKLDKKTSQSRCANCCNEIIDTSIWKNKKYMVWAIAFPASLFGYFVPYMHLVKHLNDILPGTNGELLITCIGAASGVGRIIFGKIADIPNINRILLQQLSFFALGVLTMLLAAANAYWIFVVLCLGLGLFDGCFITLLGPIAFDIVGMKGAPQAIGCLLGLCSLPLTLGPPIAGWMYDHMGQNYIVALLAAGIPPIVGSLLMFIIGRVKQPETQDCQQDAMLKPSATEETTVFHENEDDENNVWKLRPEFQKPLENGCLQSNQSKEAQQNLESNSCPVQRTSGTEGNKGCEILIEKQSTC